MKVTSTSTGLPREAPPHTHGRTRMTPGVAEDLAEDLAGAVDDAPAAPVKSAAEATKPPHAEHSADAVDAARGIRRRGKGVQRTGARIRPRVFRRDLGADLADGRERTGDERSWPEV